MINTENKVQVGRKVEFQGGYGIGDNYGVITFVRDDGSFDVAHDNGRVSRNIRRIDGSGVGYYSQDEVLSPMQVVEFVKAAQEEKQRIADEEAAKHNAWVEAQAKIKVEDKPVFYWNGIKDEKGGDIQRAYYWKASGNMPEGTIQILAKDYTRFSKKVKACFTVENGTDMMTDYFEKDRFYVVPTHPLYADVKAAFDKCEARQAKKYGK